MTDILISTLPSGTKDIQASRETASDFGGGYLLCGSLIREVAEKSKSSTSFVW